MIGRLDHLLFGSGHGLASPLCDETYYWINDGTKRGGRMYTYCGGLGAQLRSCEWRAPKPGTVRVLKGRCFEVLFARRRGPRVFVSWAMSHMKDLPDLDSQHATIADLKRDLHGMFTQTERRW